MTPTNENQRAEFDVSPVGPFTGFGNFLRKELTDWWKSWRLLVVFLVVLLVQVMEVLFAYEDRGQLLKYVVKEEVPPSLIAASVLLDLYHNPFLFIFILIFSTMAILTAEKSTGTLAWNLTKPLGRTAVFTAKLVGATLMLWLAMCVLPMIVSSIVMIAVNKVTPDFAKIIPIVMAALIWIAFWVLLILTISLGFQSQGAVAGIAIACWVVPFLLSLLLEQIFGAENREWILDRFAPNSPYWTFYIVADQKLNPHKDEVRNVWYYAFAVWTIALSVFSLRVFNRQEIGA